MASTTCTARLPGVQGRHLLAARRDHKASGVAAPSRGWRTESHVRRKAAAQTAEGGTEERWERRPHPAAASASGWVGSHSQRLRDLARPPSTWNSAYRGSTRKPSHCAHCLTRPELSERTSELPHCQMERRLLRRAKDALAGEGQGSSPVPFWDMGIPVQLSFASARSPQIWLREDIWVQGEGKPLERLSKTRQLLVDNLHGVWGEPLRSSLCSPFQVLRPTHHRTGWVGCEVAEPLPGLCETPGSIKKRKFQEINCGSP